MKKAVVFLAHPVNVKMRDSILSHLSDQIKQIRVSVQKNTNAILWLRKKSLLYFADV